MNSNQLENVSIRPITVKNWKEAIKLEVSESQKSFVASNIHSIAESSFYETSYNYGIFQNDSMVGFILLFLPPEEENNGHIVRFMIDKKYQRKGLGSEAISCIIRLIHEEFRRKEITLTVIPTNHAARAFYEKNNFVNTGEIVDGELKYKYRN
ncbi:MAG: GNAT family N-acetyltransferase [Promethearchaeota archaeon]|jgi:diamine N-acetyltransferase